MAALAELPRGAHCPSCNIDYDRDFEKNVELSFAPAPAVRPIMAGGFCLSGPMATPHVAVQLLLAPLMPRLMGWTSAKFMVASGFLIMALGCWLGAWLSADALQGVGAEDHLHPVHEERVDGEAVARAIAQGRATIGRREGARARGADGAARVPQRRPAARQRPAAPARGAAIDRGETDGHAVRALPGLVIGKHTPSAAERRPPPASDVPTGTAARTHTA